ncbi:MAG: DUF4156 domain-containing protein [Polyangiaceae bacterium]|nr:DUF4156 domain-containing protein [Polyangiaceae bacterium]
MMGGSLLVTAAACADNVPEHVVLVPMAEDVYIATEPPSAGGYTMVGQVTGQAQAPELDSATEAAKNDLRNKAANLGASLVTIDDVTGEPVLLAGKTKVTLVGRAYKPVD